MYPPYRVRRGNRKGGYGHGGHIAVERSRSSGDRFPRRGRVNSDNLGILSSEHGQFADEGQEGHVRSACEAEVFALVRGEADLLDARAASVVPEDPAMAVEERGWLVN